MMLTKLVNGVRVELTAQEQSAIEAERQAAAIPTADQVIAEEDRRLSEGAVFLIDGYATPIPLRATPKVQTEIAAQAQVARELADSGVTAAVLPVWDKAGAMHMLTPSQMRALFVAGATWVAAMRAASKTMQAADPIPADFAASSRWPEP